MASGKARQALVDLLSEAHSRDSQPRRFRKERPMSEVTFEQVLSQVKALPLQDRVRLREYLSAQEEKDKTIVEARERARACATRDLSAEYRWIEEHRDEYAGQWVALKGDQLISNS